MGVPPDSTNLKNLYKNLAFVEVFFLKRVSGLKLKVEPGIPR
jgi:hypothetical protein